MKRGRYIFSSSGYRYDAGSDSDHDWLTYVLKQRLSSVLIQFLPCVSQRNKCMVLETLPTRAVRTSTRLSSRISSLLQYSTTVVVATVAS